MAVSLILSRTKGASNVADTLAGGGSGIDFGNVTNASFSGVVGDKLDNIDSDAVNLFYLRHNATIDPITELKVYIAQFHLTYGGATTAANDYSGVSHGMVGEGLASGSSKNNGDGLSSGFWMDMQWDVSTANQFDYSTRVNSVRIFGKPLSGVTGDLATTTADGVDQNGQDGTSLEEAFTMSPLAMIYSADDIAEVAATTPIKGRIGKDNDTVLGDYAKFKQRVYLRDSYPDGGIIQFSCVYSFSFTA
jgi:hypothetical protein